MPEETQPAAAQPSVPLDNVASLVDDKLVKLREGAPPEPSQVATTEMTPTAPAWADVVVPEDVPQKFIAGKKVSDVVKSWEHAQKALSEKEKERAELQQRLEKQQRDHEAEQAARRVLAESLRGDTTTASPEDPRLQEVADLWIENPKAAWALMEQMQAEKYQAQISEAFQSYEKQRYAEAEQRAQLDAGRNAYDTARDHLKVSPDVWNKRAKAVLVELTDEKSPYYGDGMNIFRPEAYVAVYNDIFGVVPAATQTMQPVFTPPVIPDPPISRPVATPPPSNGAVSPLTAEARAVREAMARAAGLSDPKGLIARAERRSGARNA